MHFSAEERAELLNKLDEFFARAQVDDIEANVFRQLYRQFLEETHYIDWNSWKFIADSVQRNHADLPNFDPSRKDVLDGLIVVKLNGGLGTTMGCDGPKSFIKVFNKTHNSNVPLYLMNSFYTEEQTRQKLGANSGMRTFCQSKCPRIWADSLLPVEGTGTNQEWYPPGHGNIFHALNASGVLDQLLSQGSCCDSLLSFTFIHDMDVSLEKSGVKAVDESTHVALMALIHT
ncbi:UTP--glucose-1-phosphate uridylyltransferase [Ancylostoma duodenale]|uniref:UTP--glucose-1-phosphate uridylyltransferase n=1 Tax=Ancylostoma duodenale TaxID=51022 RepID=A0A0C2GD28_9BILA|nr:UTP--glucose-1-phosphate uridylyltransferase [Ancylostoma duodenale]